MSFQSMYNQYINRTLKSECDWKKNQKNPGRCKAAQQYAKEMRKFVDKAVKSSITTTKQTKEKLLKQRLDDPESNKKVYPLINHDFDYKTALLKKYNPYSMGITNEPTIDNLVKGPMKLKKFYKILVKDKYPADSTVAGTSDILDDDKRSVEIKKIYKNKLNKLPYPSFRKDFPKCKYPTTGKHSSSYFLKTGTCKTKITDEKKCKKKGYQWIKNKLTFPPVVKQLLTPKKQKKAVKPILGTCYKPKYSYIDNSAKGYFGNHGLGPSLINDAMNISPDKLFNILAGYSTGGSGALPCIEDFRNKNDSCKFIDSKSKLTILFIIMFLFMIIWMKK